MVIPVFNSAGYLRRCLESLEKSARRPLEILVVDDGSTDGTVAVAEEFNVRVLRMEERGGPSKARNRGAAEARGDIVLFLDADVCVHADTVERIAHWFVDDPKLDALFGSYDETPGSPDFLSQYRNLMHAFVHQQARSSATTFWSGCGAIRRELFLQHGGFDESGERPATEDIELGYRLHLAGCKIILDRDIRVTHLKRWTFWNLVHTDIVGRGIPWTELILRDRHLPNDLNVGLSQRVSVALMFLLTGMSLFAAFWWKGYFLTPLFAVLFLVMGRYWVEFTDYRERKIGLVLTTGIVAAIVAAAWFHHQQVLIPPLLLGYLLTMMKHRYEYEKRGIAYSLALAAAITLAFALFELFYVPYHQFVFAVIVVFLLVVLLNTQFYVFLSEKRGAFFAVAAIPFHLLYHFYNGISFIAGSFRYYLITGRRPQAARARQTRLSERQHSVGGD